MNTQQINQNKAMEEAARIKMRVYEILDSHDLTICFAEGTYADFCTLADQLQHEVNKLRNIRSDDFVRKGFTINIKEERI